MIALGDSPAPGPADLVALGVAGYGLYLMSQTQAPAVPRAQDRSRPDPIFRHYTTEEGFLGITESGVIRPSADRLVYVTPTIYTSSAAAQKALELSRTPAGFFEIPQSRLPGLTPQPPTSGGGIQFTAPGPVNATGLRWVPIGP